MIEIKEEDISRIHYLDTLRSAFTDFKVGDIIDISKLKPKQYEISSEELPNDFKKVYFNNELELYEND